MPARGEEELKEPIVITGASRTPLGAFRGALAGIPAPRLGAAAIAGALKSSEVPATRIDEVFMGCVLPAGLGQAPARQAARFAGIPDAAMASTISKVCGSGMKAVMLAHDTLAAGSADWIIAGGMENMSNAPYLLAQARAGYRYGHDRIFDMRRWMGWKTPMSLAARWAVLARIPPRIISSAAPRRMNSPPPRSRARKPRQPAAPSSPRSFRSQSPENPARHGSAMTRFQANLTR
jgi:hypothetical protein